MGSRRRARNSSSASSSRIPSSPRDARVDQPGGDEGGDERHDLRESGAPEPLVEAVPDAERARGSDRGREGDASDDRERSTDVLEADPTAHQHEERRGAEDVHGCRRERDSPDAEAIEARVERRVETDGAQGDRRRDPVRLDRVEAAVEQQHPAVEDQPDRERLQAVGDDRRVARRELPPLVDEPARSGLRARSRRGRRGRARRRSAEGRRPARDEARLPRRGPRAAQGSGRGPSRRRRRRGPAGACTAGTPCRSPSARARDRAASTRRACPRRSSR